MAFKNHYSDVVDVHTLYCKAAIGASGAPTIDTAVSKGISSISRTAAGDYTVTLAKPYNSLLWAAGTLLESDDTDLQIQIAAEAVSNATPTVQFICTAAATPADPPDGSTMYFKIEVKRSSV
jgi:hypothetical protein